MFKLLATESVLYIKPTQMKPLYTVSNVQPFATCLRAK